VSGARRAVAAGVTLAVVYVIAASSAARLDPFADRPVLDGLAPPPQYNWVSPPPALASSNKAPASGRADVPLGPSGSQAGVFPTTDFQVQLVLATGAIPRHGSDDSVRLALTPSAPSSDEQLPSGLTIAGNVYLVSATYQPSGLPVTRLGKLAQLRLAYPLLFQGLIGEDTMLRSTDAGTWSSIPSRDSIASQAVHANISQLGYYAVGQSAAPSGSSPAGATRSWAPIAVAGIVALIGVALIAMAVVARRRASRSADRTAQGDGAGRRSPPRRDMWED
jgi:hypothetical protein